MLWTIIIALTLFNIFTAWAIHRTPKYAAKMQERANEGRGLLYFTVQSSVLILSIPWILIYAIIRGLRGTQQNKEEK